MNIKKLDHVNVRTNQLETMVNWYSDVLDMHSGARPNFPFDGAWMYIGDVAPVHLVGINNTDAIGSDVELQLEHFALSANGLESFEEKLRRLEIPFRRADIPEIHLVQINIWDPDGNHIHIDFDDEI